MLTARAQGWTARLRGFARGAAPQQRCELCSAPVRADHRHLFDVSRRRLLCSCQACAVLFGGAGQYRLVPARGRPLSGFRLSDAQWDALQIPIDIAFFVKSTAQVRVVALYPGPAGTTESLLDLSAWEELQGANPVLAEFEPDVEALLVNRAHGAREYYRVPIDACYALSGIIRVRWRGLSGGAEAWAAIRAFFAELQGGVRAADRGSHA